MDTEKKDDLTNNSAEDNGINVEVKTNSSQDSSSSTAVEISEDGTLSTNSTTESTSTAPEVSETPERSQSGVDNSVAPEPTSEEFSSDPVPQHGDSANSEQPPESVDYSQHSEESMPQHEDHNQMAIPAQPPKKSGKPIAAIIAAIIIVIALIGVSVFAFVKTSQKKPVKQTTKTSTETKKTTKTEVTADDVSSTSKDIDTEINKTNDAKDLPTSESVNDQSLGL